MLSTLFLVTGALLLGDALHGSVVTGQYPVTSPAAVVRAVAGLVSIAIGYHFQTPVDEYSSVPSTEPEETSSDGASGEFDSELSPLSDEQLENMDADEEK